METIGSRKNPLVTLMRRVAAGDAEERGRVLLDGLHLVQEARAAGVPISAAAFASKLLATPDGLARRLATTLAGLGCRVVQVSDAVMEAMSPVSTPSGVVALATRPRHDLPALVPTGPAAPRAALIVVAVDVQDPGNIGAMIRAAEAGGATGFVSAGVSADPFGWKALRGAMGSAFRLPVVREPDTASVLKTLKDAGVRLLATVPDARLPFDAVDLTQSCALLLGGEGPGLAPELQALADASIAIPMQEPVESLNVASAAALLIYEARRQRVHAARREPALPFAPA